MDGFATTAERTRVGILPSKGRAKGTGHRTAPPLDDPPDAPDTPRTGLRRGSAPRSFPRPGGDRGENSPALANFPRRARIRDAGLMEVS